MTSETTAKKNVQKLQRAIVDGLEDVKAQDIQVFNTEHLSSLFERVIVASGTSNRQTKALAASVRDAVREAGFDKPRTEGEDNGEWIIVDCGPAVVHVMQPSIRQYYRLEEIWGDKPVRLKHAAANKAAVGPAPVPEKPKAKAKPKAMASAPATPASKAPARKASTAASKTFAGKTASAKKAVAKPAPTPKVPARKTAAAAPAPKLVVKAKAPATQKPAVKSAPKPAPKPAAKAGPRAAVKTASAATPKARKPAAKKPA